MRILCAACTALGMAMSQSALAEPSVSDLAARMELHAIETLTVSDQQFLVGDKNGKTASLAGVLRFPRTTSGRGSGRTSIRGRCWMRRGRAGGTWTGA